MNSLRQTLRRKPYKPPSQPLAWVPTCEYYVVIVAALMSFMVAYFYLVGVVFTQFHGLFDEDSLKNRTYDGVDDKLKFKMDGYLPKNGTYEDSQKYRMGKNPSEKKSPETGRRYIELRAYYTNLHLILNAMVPIFYANGILMFRVWCCYNRTVVKAMHCIILVLPIPQVVASLPYISKWSSYVDSPLTGYHFWSLHAWIGFAFLGLFVITLVSGIYVFVIMPGKEPFETAEFRAKFVPYHSFMGTTLFFMTVLQVITGVTNTAAVLTWDTWKDREHGNYMSLFKSRHKSMKVTILLYAFSTMPVLYALARDDFRIRGRIILTKDLEVNLK